MGADTHQSNTAAIQGDFSASSEQRPPYDPLVRTPMKLSLDEVQEYDHNPRNERNAKYDEIKEAIRVKRGLDSQLTITRRPGDTGKPYTCYAGGNTRLRILKELYAETGDPAFYTVQCVYVPWVSEFNTIAAHLIENDIRGNLVFIDRALAIHQFCVEYQKTQENPVSIRELVEALKREGYVLDGTSLSRMKYAVEVLWPVIPSALRAGMGIEQVRKLRRLEDAIIKLIEHYQRDEIKARPVFLKCLSEHDGSHWNYEAIIRSAADRLAELCETPATITKFDLDALLKGHSPGRNAPKSTSFFEQNDTKQPKKAKTPVVKLNSIPVNPKSIKIIPQASESETSVSDTLALRTQIWMIATQLTQRNDMDQCVLHSRHGCGFIMDLPEFPLYENPRTPSASEVLKIDLWWFLSSFTGQWVSDTINREAFLESCPTESRLHPILQTLIAGDSEHHQQAHDAIATYVCEPRSILDLPSLLLRLGEADYKALADMMCLQRQLHAISSRGEKRFS